MMMVDTQNETAISVYDPEVQNSVVNIIGSGPLYDGIKKISSKYREMSEQDFEAEPKITDTEKALRIQFWQEFNRRADRPNTSSFVIQNIYLGICTAAYFYRSICSNPIKLAYILLPPRSYETDLRLLLDIANAKRKEILSMDSYTTTRSGARVPNDRLIGLQIKLLESLENRLFGTAIARSASVETQVKADSPEGKELQKHLSHDEASKEIRRLASRVEELKSGGDVIDAEISE